MSSYDDNLPSEGQRNFALIIAERLEIEIDENILINRDDLTEWINEYKNIPSPKQIELAEQIAQKKGKKLSDNLFEDSEALSIFIDENIHLINSNKPSTKQIHFAKTIAKKLKIELLDEVLTDKKLLKDWIDKHNKSAENATGLKKKKVQ